MTEQEIPGKENPSSNVAHDVTRNAIVQLGTRCATTIVGIATLGLMTRTLGPRNFGLFEFALTFVGYFLSASDLGIRTILVRRLAADPDHEGVLLGAGWSLKLIVAALLTPFPWLVANYFGFETDTRNAILLASPILILSALETPTVIFQARRRMEWSAIGPILQSVAYLLLCIWGATHQWSIKAWIAGFVATIALGSASTVFIARRLFQAPLRCDRHQWASLIGEGWPIGLSFAIFLIGRRLDMLMLERIRNSLEEVGLYGFAFRFVEFGTFICGALINAILPWLSMAHFEDEKLMVRMVRNCARGMALISTFMAIVLAVGAPLVTAIAGGTHFKEAAPLIGILGWLLPWYFLEATLGIALIAAGRARLSALANAVGLVVRICLGVWLIPVAGPRGAAIASVVTQAIECLLLFVLCCRQLRAIPLDWRFGGFMISAAAAIGVLYQPWMELRFLAIIILPVMALLTKTVNIHEVRNFLRR